MVNPKQTNLTAVLRDSPSSVISGGEIVPCPITSVFLTLVVNPNRQRNRQTAEVLTETEEQTDSRGTDRDRGTDRQQRY